MRCNKILKNTAQILLKYYVDGLFVDYPASRCSEAL